MIPDDIGSRLVAFILIGFGALLLLSQGELFGGGEQGFLLVTLFVGGTALLSAYAVGRKHAWVLPLGFALLGLGSAALLGELGGATFLGLLGAGFYALYRQDRRQWWALLPGGVLVSLALAAGAAVWLPELGGALFFLGLAATAFSLYRLPQRVFRWTLLPTLAFLFLALASSAPVRGLWGVFLPLLLTAGGLSLVLTERLKPSDERPFTMPTFIRRVLVFIGAALALLIVVDLVGRNLFSSGRLDQGAGRGTLEAEGAEHSLPAVSLEVGSELYSRNCAGCHGGEGEGRVGPALAGNDRLADPSFVTDRILNGGGGMPAWDDRLSDGEIASVATFVREAWGNDFGEVSEAEVAGQR